MYVASITNLVDEEAWRLVAMYVNGQESEEETRNKLGELLFKTQAHIYAISCLRRSGRYIPSNVDYQDVSQQLLIRLWNRIQRTGDKPPFDLRLFHSHKYSFSGWAKANAKNAVFSLVETETDSTRSRHRSEVAYDILVAPYLSEDTHTDYEDQVLLSTAERSANKSWAFNCLLIRQKYDFPEPPGLAGKYAKQEAIELIQQLRRDYHNVRKTLQEPVAKIAIAHWQEEDYRRASALPDQVVAAVLIEALCNRAIINRQFRVYRQRQANTQKLARQGGR